MKVTIEEAKKQIAIAIKAYLCKDKNNQYLLPAVGRLPIYLLGRPGIGKTEVVQEVAEELGIGYVSFSLTHHTRNSLLGLPVIRQLEDGRSYTEFTMSEIIAAVEKARAQGFEEGILMLDEFNSISETVFPLMLAFLQTKNIGEFHLPEGWIITLAGNPSADNRSARALDMALLDRVRMIEVEYDEEVFLAYAREKKFHPSVIEYLEQNPGDSYLLEKQEDQITAVTARGWENLSRMLYVLDQIGEPVSPCLISQFIKSDRIVCGFTDYLTLCRLGCTKEDMDGIMNGTADDGLAESLRSLPENALWLMTDYLYHALSHRMVSPRSSKKPDFSRTFDHTFLFLEKLGNRLVTERLFGLLNRDARIVKALVAAKNTTYPKLCKAFINGAA